MVSLVLFSSLAHALYDHHDSQKRSYGLLLVFFLFSLGFGKESYYATSKISARIICQTIEYGL